MLVSFRVLAFILLAGSTLQAQTHSWTSNAGDNNWFTTSNWDANTVPAANSEVLIGSEATVEIISGGATVLSISISENGNLRVGNNLQITTMDIAQNATLFFDEGHIKGLPSLITNNGTIRLEGFTTHILEDLIIQNNNLFLVIESNQSELIDLTMNNAVDGVIDIPSNGGFVDQASNTVINNEGILKKSPGSTTYGNFYLIHEINNTGTIEVFENQTFLLLSSSDTFTNLAEGIIQGNGVYDITTNFNNAGTVYPGNQNQVGQLDVTNNLSLNGGVIEFDINGTNTQDYDRIVMIGSPSMDGFIALNVTTPLEVGDSFEIITWTSSGSPCSFPPFVTTNFDGAEYDFDIFCNSNSVSLVLQGIITLGVDDVEPLDFSFNISPNPISENTRFYFSSELIAADQVSLSINTMDGRKVDSIEQVTDGAVYDRSHLASGLYFAQLEADNKVIATAKLLLE